MTRYQANSDATDIWTEKTRGDELLYRTARRPAYGRVAFLIMLLQLFIVAGLGQQGPALTPLEMCGNLALSLFLLATDRRPA